MEPNTTKDKLARELKSFESKYAIIDTKVLDVKKYLAERLNTSEALGYYEGVFYCHKYMAAHNIILGDEEAAFEHLELARSVIDCRQIDTSFYAGLANTYIMYYGDLVGDMETAMEYYEWGLKFATESGNGFDTVNLKGNFAAICIDQGYFEEGIRIFKETNSYLEQNGLEEYLLYHYENMAKAYLGLEDYDESWKYYSLAYEMSKTYNNHQVQCTAALGKSRILAQRGDYDEAINCLTKEVNLNSSAKGNIENIEMAVALAQLLYDKGENLRSAMILNSYDQQLQQCLNHQVRFNYYRLFSNIKELHGRYDEAFVYEKMAHASHVALLRKKDRTSVEGSISRGHKTRFLMLQTLSQMGNEIANCVNLSEAMSVMYEQLSKIMSIDAIGIGRLVNDSIHCSHFISEGLFQPSRVYPLEPVTSFAAWVLKNDQSILLRDVAESYSKFIDNPKSLDGAPPSGEDMKSLMYAPISFKGKAIGAFTIQSNRIDAYSNEDLEIFKIVSAYVTVILRNSPYYIDRPAQ